jgi:hypothetical protein
LNQDYYRREKGYRNLLYGIVLLCLIGIGAMYSVDALSVEEYSSNYIIWNTTGETQIVLDGIPVNVSGSYYGQYDLQPGSVHYGSSGDTGLRVVLKQDLTSMLLYWGVYLILCGMIIIAYRYPISGILPVVFGIYLFTNYLPTVNATFIEYAMIGIMLALGIIASAAGYQRG